MKTCFKNPADNLALIFLMLVTMFICGCDTAKLTPDPLAGFHAGDFRDLNSNKAITDDYNAYIQTLSPEEKYYLGPSPIGFFEDGMGQHAIKIEIGINGTSWVHVLIYDKDNKRIKTIKYSPGGYRS